MSIRYPEIDEVIAYIHKHIDEPLSLSRLADHVSYSPFHFTRIFKERMGLTPQYYVSSLRLQKAKDLLLNTNLSIRDIGLEIGQQSLGTFTTRFTERVGVSPAQFRSSTQHADGFLRSLQQLSDWRKAHLIFNPYDTMNGTVSSEHPFEGVILIGLFAKPIPEGMPIYGTLVTSLGEFSLYGVKPGIYYLMATSVAWGMQAIDFLLPHNTLRTRSREPIVVEPNKPIPHQEVKLYPPSLDDPPILISLPMLMNNFLNRIARAGFDSRTRIVQDSNP